MKNLILTSLLCSACAVGSVQDDCSMRGWAIGQAKIVCCTAPEKCSEISGGQVSENGKSMLSQILGWLF